MPCTLVPAGSEGSGPPRGARQSQCWGQRHTRNWRTPKRHQGTERRWAEQGQPPYALSVRTPPPFGGDPDRGQQLKRWPSKTHFDSEGRRTKAPVRLTCYHGLALLGFLGDAGAQRKGPPNTRKPVLPLAWAGQALPVRPLPSDRSDLCPSCTFFRLKNLGRWVTQHPCSSVTSPVKWARNGPVSGPLAG